MSGKFTVIVELDLHDLDSAVCPVIAPNLKFPLVHQELISFAYLFKTINGRLVHL